MYHITFNMIISGSTKGLQRALPPAFGGLLQFGVAGSLHREQLHERM